MRIITLFVSLCLTSLLHAQVANQPSPLSYCDDDNDGFGTFDLDQATPEVLGSQSATDYTVTYHETLQQAQDNTGSVSSLYQNINAYNQSLYVRLEENTTGNYDTTTLELRVENGPVLSADLISYVLCDADGLNDGYTTFDLTNLNSQILNGLNPSNYVLTYHLSESDAEANTNVISNPSSFINTSSGLQIIYARVESTITSCASIKEITLEVNELPIANYTEIEECDDGYWENMDGVYVFNLNDYVEIITQGASNVNVEFYEEEDDAQVGTNAITNPEAYANSAPGPDLLFVRVTNNITGCYAVGNLVLRVLPNPTPAKPETLGVMKECDGNIDGGGTFEEQIAVFDLTAWELTILSGDGPGPEPFVNLTYHESLNDAQSGSNVISNPSAYSNVSNSQIIYVRATNVNTNCFTVTWFEIEVSLPPVVLEANSDFICVDQNGIVIGDFPILMANVSPQSIADFNFEWQYNGTVIPGEIGDYITVMQAGEYTVTVTNEDDSLCFNTFSYIISESASAQSYSVNVTSDPCDTSQVIEAIVSGEGNYSFSLDGGIVNSTGIWTDVSVGNHTVQIMNEGNCEVITVEVTVEECQLSNTNFTVEAVSETCVDMNNGKIRVDATENYTYTAVLTRGGVNVELLSPNLTNNETYIITNLEPGNYNLCITANEINQTHCFDLFIQSVENLDAFSSLNGNTYEVNLSGSLYYEVIINDIVEIVESNSVFEEVVYQKELNINSAVVSIKTDKDCQGVFEETIFIGEETVVLSKNPVLSELNLYVPSKFNNANVEVFNLSGQRVNVFRVDVTGYLKLDVSNLQIGLYMVKVSNNSNVFLTKFLKQ